MPCSPHVLGWNDRPDRAPAKSRPPPLTPSIYVIHLSRMSPTGRKDEGLERAWKALASDVRRDMLDALFEGPKSTGELGMLFPDLTRFAVMQHLRVLIRAKLVISSKKGPVALPT